MTSAPIPAPLFDLTAKRVILFYDRSRFFSIGVRPPSESDWDAYFNASSISSEQHGAERISIFDFETARVLLAERVINEAVGYAVKGDQELTAIPDWPTRLPLAHRRQVGATLADVHVSAPTGDFVIQPEGEEVLLDATYTALEGKMVKLTGLKHTFNSPTQAQHKRYNQQASRSVITGGSRSGRTVYPTTHAVLADLYDELIVEVEGYARDSAPITDAADARTYMDFFHKVIAAQELFAPTSTVSTVTTEAAESE